MRNDRKYAIAMTEFLYYLKGFPDEYIKKIPTKLLNFFEENCDKNYTCNFDYNKNLEELCLRDETYGLISMICYNYWCETPKEKKEYLKILNENERRFNKKILKHKEKNGGDKYGKL